MQQPFLEFGSILLHLAIGTIRYCVCLDCNLPFDVCWQSRSDLLTILKFLRHFMTDEFVGLCGAQSQNLLDVSFRPMERDGARSRLGRTGLGRRLGHFKTV
jgi:hypothetical protein